LEALLTMQISRAQTDQVSTACLMHPSGVVLGLLRDDVRAAVERDDTLCRYT